MRIIRTRILNNPRRRASAAVEFALIGPLLVTMVLGAVDLGRFAYNYIAVTNAARAGAAYAIMNPYLSNQQSAWNTAVQQAARDEMAGQTGFVSTNLTVPAPIVTVDAKGRRIIQVTANYPFSTLINWNWTGLSIPSSMTLKRMVEMRAIR